MDAPRERKVNILKGPLGLSMATCLIGIGMVVSVGCSSSTQGARAPDPTTVEVVQVEQKDVPIYTEWIGTTDGVVNADIKAQVSGYLLRQDYTEGSIVKKGQLLFEIDPRPFQAVVDQGEGQLAQANGQVAQAEAQLAVVEANEVRTRLDVERYTPLAKQQAISQQDLDNATQNNVAAKAQVQSAKAQIETARAQIQGANAAIQAVTATVETAKLNLSFTKLTSPIEGLAGMALQQVGALVRS